MEKTDYELVCGQVQTAIDFTEIMPTMMCTVHKRQEKVVAIECRKWRGNCNSLAAIRNRRCGYTKWCETATEAIRLMDEHRERSGHQTQTIDFMRAPQRMKLIKQRFPRATKSIIVPKERQNKSEDMRPNKDKTQPTLFDQQRLEFNEEVEAKRKGYPF